MPYKGNIHILKNRFSSLLLLMVVWCTSLQAQNTYDLYVKNLNAESIDGKLYVTWTTRAGFSCQDIHVELSTDSIENYQIAATYFGICGDTTEKDYQILIENPIANRLNYVRLQLGIFGYSYFVTERVVNARNEVIILPHPVVNESKLFFDNSLNQEITLQIVTTKGETIYESSTLDDYFSFQRRGLPTGIYIYLLKRDEKIIQRGRLVLAERL